jgi:hypothetical protein
LILLRQKSELVSTIFITKEEYAQKAKSSKNNNKAFGNNFNNDYNNFLIDEMIESGINKYQKPRYSNKDKALSHKNTNYIIRKNNSYSIIPREKLEYEYELRNLKRKLDKLKIKNRQLKENVNL